ncbi:hypothetical protein AN928_15355 [Pseudomonas aeruginosa]|nr:hypothetical protein AN929_15445 [Pseudomonas aeruginosa]KZM07850.1 hypothetical protein AN928_15355 [Pseudomonas aeruginosa]KZM13811.1 hypothetical protein AN930_14595 [Pseudomonas aeruginosa]PCK45480.1 hypothetical protein A2J14_19590 [Pseudomonas aeruginosa]PCK51541.1 hypothetical protein A2J12_21420 [Pseudomonas aeruginosa]
MSTHILPRLKYLKRSLSAQRQESGIADLYPTFVDLESALTDAKHHFCPLLTWTGKVATRRKNVVWVDQAMPSNVSDSVSQFHLVAARA